LSKYCSCILKSFQTTVINDRFLYKLNISIDICGIALFGNKYFQYLFIAILCAKIFRVTWALMREGFTVLVQAKKKSYRNFPPASMAKDWKFKKFISLVRNGLFHILFLLSVPKILKICLKIVEEKSMTKSCNREICYFPHPFSSKQHQNLFSSEILPY